MRRWRFGPGQCNCCAPYHKNKEDSSPHMDFVREPKGEMSRDELLLDTFTHNKMICEQMHPLKPLRNKLDRDKLIRDTLICDQNHSQMGSSVDEFYSAGFTHSSMQ